MPVARQVAQIGSVIGRDFSRALLASAVELPDSALDEALDQLVTAGLLFRRGEGVDAAYMFKHVLVQDTAYESLLRARRAALHRTIGKALECGPEMGTARPALLGHHFAQAGEGEKASFYLLQAGEQSAAASAMIEAEAHLIRGLAITSEMADANERNRREAELTLTLGNVHMALHGIGSAEHRASLAKAVELCRALDSRDQVSVRLLARSLFGLAICELTAGSVTNYVAISREAAAAITDSSDPGLRALAAGISACGCVLGGDLKDEDLDVQWSFPAIGSRDPPEPAIDFGFDAHCFLCLYLARGAALRGYSGKARSLMDAVLDRARKIQHLPSFVVTLSVLCAAAWSLRDRLQLKYYSDEHVRATTEQGYTPWYARSISYVGWVRAAEGKHEEGLVLLDRALEQLASAGTALYVPHTCAMRADVHTQMGHPELAEADLDHALSIAERTGEAWPEAELHRRKGELRRADPLAAENCFRRAVSVARAQGAKLFELRASVSLARLWRDSGRTGEALDLLAPIYGWFTEGFEEIDLVEARTLLDELTMASTTCNSPTCRGGCS
jgi:tetratricopeptide (TPR) repeat protein